MRFRSYTFDISFLVFCNRFLVLRKSVWYKRLLSFQTNSRSSDLKLKMFWKICVSLLVLGSASAAKTKKATCVQVSPMKSFKASSFAGRWFEIKRDSSIDQIESLEGSCTYLNFSVATGNNLTIAFSTVLKNRAVNSQAPVKVSSNGQFDWSLNLGAGNEKTNFKLQIIYNLFNSFN